MKISLNNIWLTNDGVTDLRAWSDAHAVRFNGTQLVQEAGFLRAALAAPLARGNVTNELAFSVTRQHGSAAEAAAFALSAFAELPSSGACTVVCGAPGEAPVTVTFAAVLAAMPSCAFHGTRSDVSFVLRGGAMKVLPASTVGAIDGGAFSTSYSFSAGGTMDGGSFADALLPAGLKVDGGAFA